jgi:SGNH hydrolase-like domain, acetyltransferase AlgX
MVVIVLAQNDFEESYEFKPGVYTSAFLKLQLKNSTVSHEMEPVPYERPWYYSIRASATWRYVGLRERLQFQAFRDLVFGQKTKRQYQANIDVSKLNEEEKSIEAVTSYIFRQLKDIANEKNIKLLLLIDGDRHNIYMHRDSRELYKTGALRLNRIAGTAAHQTGIAFIDLHPVFESDYAIHKKMFNFVEDGHWNEYGHRVVARAIARFLKEG